MLNLTHDQRSNLEQTLAELDVEEPGNCLSDMIRTLVLGEQPLDRSMGNDGVEEHEERKRRRIAEANEY